MRSSSLLVLAASLLLCPGAVQAQRMQDREVDFLKLKPRVGDPLPDVTISSSDGSLFKTEDLRGHYTVLTFGCLTCPPSMWSIAGLEAVHRDYSPKGVKFYFIYKSLAHPELAGHIVQPFTLGERLAHARHAKARFGTQIPWVVDAMDNRLKHALGDRPNSQFLVDPKGIIVRKRAWANAELVRKDLEDLVGQVDSITREEDLPLNIGQPLESAAPRGIVSPIGRDNMGPIVVKPQIEANGLPFFAKLRAEATPRLLREGAGQLYLGFHLDPFHDAHWNNLTKPLSFKIEAADGVVLDAWDATAPKASAASDADPREFLLKVESWPVTQPLQLTVTYFACVGTEPCHAVQQKYVLHRRRDNDGGGARSAGAGDWDEDEFARRMLASDQDNDGKVKKSEAAGIIQPHFEKLDANQDGFLDREELKVVSRWLNHHHQAGAPPSKSHPGR